MRKKITGLLLAASLALGVVGCGKSEGDAVGLPGAQKDRSSLAISSLDGDAVDLPDVQGNEDIEDATGGADSAMDFSEATGESGTAGRNKIQEDFVIVPLPVISKDAFGSGFYDTYALIPPARESFDYDEDGLLTDAKFPWGDPDEKQDARLTLSYEKSGGMVTGCEISADLYPWFLERYKNAGARYSMAEEDSEELAAKMPYRLVFDEPIEPDPDGVAEAILGKVAETIEMLDNALLPSMNSYFFEAFQEMYQSYLSGAWQTGGTGTDNTEMDDIGTDDTGTDEPEISWDTDGLLTDARVGFATESGEISESWIAIEYQKEEGMVTGCTISGDMYSFFVYECGYDEETAKERNDELTGKMPLEIVLDEPENPEEREAVAERMLYALDERAESDADYGFVEGLAYFCEMYLDKLYSDGSGSAAGNATGNAAGRGVGYEVMVGGIATQEFEGKVSAAELSGSYFFAYGGGVPMRETKITNDPGWSIDMSVSHEDVICQIETEQDSNGNITLVHLYNDYAIYDEVFTYDGAGRMTRRDHYEYPKGQNREAVGALWYDEYSYDGEGRLIGAREQSTQDNGVNTEIAYYYDDMGRMAGQEVHTSYFGNDFMTMQQVYDSVVQSYDYDDSGKVETVTVTVNWAQTVLQPDPTEPTTVVYLPER